VNLQFQRENINELWSDLAPLIEQHYQEIARYHDIPLNPDVEQYGQLENTGMFRIYTVRHDDQLIGYAAYLVSTNIHYMDSMQAHQDVLFVTPAYRKSRIGIQLIQYADKQLQQDGVQLVYHHVKINHNFGPLLERLGYELNELLYVKRLDK